MSLGWASAKPGFRRLLSGAEPRLMAQVTAHRGVTCEPVDRGRSMRHPGIRDRALGTGRDLDRGYRRPPDRPSQFQPAILLGVTWIGGIAEMTTAMRQKRMPY